MNFAFGKSKITGSGGCRVARPFKGTLHWDIEARSGEKLSGFALVFVPQASLFPSTGSGSTVGGVSCGVGRRGRALYVDA